MEQENQRLKEQILDKTADIYWDKVSPFTKDRSVQRKAADIQQKIKTEQKAQEYAEDRMARISDRDFYQQHHRPIPESLEKGEARAQQKRDLEALKKKIEAKLGEESSLGTGRSR